MRVFAADFVLSDFNAGIYLDAFLRESHASRAR
jgi:hypothetical protein